MYVMYAGSGPNPSESGLRHIIKFNAISFPPIGNPSPFIVLSSPS
jgi:hypothetical protein